MHILWVTAVGLINIRFVQIAESSPITWKGSDLQGIIMWFTSPIHLTQPPHPAKGPSGNGHPGRHVSGRSTRPSKERRDRKERRQEKWMEERPALSIYGPESECQIGINYILRNTIWGTSISSVRAHTRARAAKSPTDVCSEGAPYLHMMGQMMFNWVIFTIGDDILIWVLLVKVPQISIGRICKCTATQPLIHPPPTTCIAASHTVTHSVKLRSRGPAEGVSSTRWAFPATWSGRGEQRRSFSADVRYVVKARPAQLSRCIISSLWSICWDEGTLCVAPWLRDWSHWPAHICTASSSRPRK